MRRRPPAKSTMLCAAVVLATVAVSACGGANNNSTGSGTLTIQGDSGNPTLVENFNPFQGAQLHGTNLIYEPLEIPSPIDGSYTPFLATAYKFTDPKTLVYTIRQGVKWSDGKDLTPADVVFTFNLLKKFPALDGKGVWSQINAISASGNDVTMTFNTANVPFAASIAQTEIVPENLWSSMADPSKDPNIKPVGSGPFVLDAFAPTQYSLKKNPTYWQADKIVPAEVLFPAQASNQSTNQLDVVSGKFDWAYNFLPDVKQTFVAKDPAHNQYWFPPGGTICLYLNLTKAPYSDVNFRTGLSLALDRKTIALKAVNGYLDQASMSGLILPNLKKWLDPSLPNQGIVNQDASGAKAAFALAGYSLQGGKLIGKNGKQATMTIVMPGNFSDWVAAAKEVVNQLATVGIAATLDLPQYAQYSQGIQAGTFDAAIGGYGGTGDPYTDFSVALNSSFASPVNTPTANNFERFKDPAVDQALATLASATDQSAQMQATYTLEQAMYKQVPIVLMYYGGSWGLFTTKHFTGWPSESDPYTLPTLYNIALLTVVTHLTKT
ncbi:MAG: peptide/nickel transport system substrate-binding protein [Chloroflexota bacterium]|nr:peptide/nickel transport system substrate-binding protein [Chloroflexota bacterium]